MICEKLSFRRQKCPDVKKKKKCPDVLKCFLNNWMGFEVVNKIQGADSQFSDETHRDGEKEDKLPGLPLSPPLTKGEAPLTASPRAAAAAAARRGGAPSAAALLPLPATNGAGQPRSGQTFSLSGSSPRGAGEWFPPNGPRPGSRLGEAESPQETTFWFPF